MSSPSPYELAKTVSDQIGQAREPIRDRTAMDDILSQAAQADPNQMDDLIGQIITRVSPQNQQAAYQVLQNKKKQALEKNRQQVYSGLADNIEKANPESGLHKTFADILRTNLPFEQKENLAKSIFSNFSGQQKRLMDESVRKRYDSVIKELSEEIKSLNDFRQADKARKEELIKEKRRIQNERNALLGIGIGAPQKKEEKKSDGTKPKFDVDNPEHLKIFEQLDEQFNGDKEKIKASLTERFTL